MMDSSAGTRGRVLVVDDTALNRRLLERALVDQGHVPILTEDGAQALEILRATSPAIDVILLDVLMPVMDGYNTLAAIKADSALHHLPVIMITAVDEIESAVRCIELGAMDYLPKPFNAALLRARLEASLADKRLRDLELDDPDMRRPQWSPARSRFPAVSKWRCGTTPWAAWLVCFSAWLMKCGPGKRDCSNKFATCKSRSMRLGRQSRSPRLPSRIISSNYGVRRPISVAS